MIDLLTFRGKWFNDIADGIKDFDYRTGHRDIAVGGIVCFKEANSKGVCTGRECFGKVNYVVHSRNAPSHFKWKQREEFTIIQFELVEKEEDVGPSLIW